MSSSRGVPIELLLAYYGDDFTGSTDVMESLSYSGIETVLFTQPPDVELLRHYPNIQAFGIAGRSRAMSPTEMDAELPAAFQRLQSFQPAIVHYKTCSTFDSSPTVGNIGRAIEIGLQVFENKCCPLVVGAPTLQRFCVFGNLFARSGLDSAPYRLDRHPTMRCHPVTPMDEADLREHLAKQTELSVRLIDVLALEAAQFAYEEHREHEGIVLFDTLHQRHLLKIGEAISESVQPGRTLFVAGSSGASYALAEYWKHAGVVAEPGRWKKHGQAVPQTLVVSGSCSPVTERQISWALKNGFDELAIDTLTLTQPERRQAELSRLIDAAVATLRSGRSVIVHTCRGPKDVRLSSSHVEPTGLGKMMADVLQATLQQIPLRRVAVTGGDSSGHVARELEIEALEMVGPMAPGSPLCTARSRSNPCIDGVEVTFKGGQVGRDTFFDTVLAGKP